MSMKRNIMMEETFMKSYTVKITGRYSVYDAQPSAAYGMGEAEGSRGEQLKICAR